MLLIPAPVPPSRADPPPADQPELAWFGSGDPPDLGEARGPAQLSTQREAQASKLVGGFGVMVLEVWQGRRPANQLEHTMAPHLAAAVLGDAKRVAGRVRLARVHARALSESTIEGALVVALPGAMASITLRLERGLAAWWCSHYHFLLPTFSRAKQGSREPSAGLGRLAVTGLELAP